MRSRIIWLLLGISVPAAAQTPPPPTPPPDPLKALEEDVKDLQDENKDLKSELDDLKARQAASKPPTLLNALNPQITAFLNGAARADNHPVFSPAGAEIDSRPFLRTAEFDFRAAVDPYADAVAILSLEDEAGAGFSADVEEGYVVVKRLPVLETAPLGLKLKLGRYRAPFGSMNKMHMHDMPWTTRPLPIARLLGTENGEFFESGYNAVGADAELILPSIGDAVEELNLDVVDGGDIAVSAGAHNHPGYLGHYNLFFTVHETSDFNIGASAYYEPGDHRVALYGGDFLYKWKPLAAGEFHSFVLGGEVFYADRKFADEMSVERHTMPLAWYGFAQLQLSWHVYAGARYDWTEDPADDTLRTQLAAGYLSYYTSEFLRFRLGYEHRWSDIAAEDGIDSLIAEVNVVFGSHPTEPYWVNR